MPRIGGSPRVAFQPEPDGPDDRYRPADDIVVTLNDYRQKDEPSFMMEGDEAVPESEAEREAADDLGDGEFTRNLAEDYPEDFLDELGAELVELVVADQDERAPARERFERGLEMMGLVESDLDDGPFPGASNAVHPLLVEAVTQFWARGMGELFPPGGPAKPKVWGHQSRQQLDRAERVTEYLNFEMTKIDRGYIPEKSRLLWNLPVYGSVFSKTFRDRTRNKNVTVYVPTDDMIVPAEATDLFTTPRFAHRMKKTPNEVKRLMHAGHYRKIDLSLPAAEETDEIDAIKDEVQDVSPDGDDDSNRHELFEVCIDRTMPGDEFLDEDGEDTGIDRSYYVTVERESGKVLSIYRGWSQMDPLCNRKIYVNHYKFIPGPKFYGLGFFHLIGGLQTAATGALRVLLDSAASASLSGGFVSRHANLKGKRLVLTPGMWEPVDATAEDMAKAFYSPPVKEPSQALFQLVGFLTERGEKFTATTELQTGDADPKNAPVGTTSMMIEQGGKVMSTVHRMFYDELGEELLSRYELCQQYAPNDGYPYEVANQQRTVYADDFGPGVSVEPVADPNIFSSAQRIAQGQTVLQTVMQTGVGNIQKAVRRFFDALRVPDVDELIPPEAEPQAYDPVGEIQAMFMGKPIKVVPEQAHVMHVKVLGAFLQNPQYGGNEAVMQQIGPSVLSVLGQHMAYAFATHARGLGVPAGYMDPQTGQVNGGGSPEQIAAMLARVAPSLATVPGLPAIDSEGKGDNQEEARAKIAVEQAKLELKKQESQQDLQHDREKHAMDMQIQRDKVEAQKEMNQAKVSIAIQKGRNDMQVAQAKANQALQQTQMEGELKQQQAQRQAAMDEQNAQRQAQMDERQMQRDDQMGQHKLQQQQQQGDLKMAQGEQQHQQKLAQGQQQDRLSSLRGGGQGPGEGMPQ
jgi:hypothetical protein